MRRLVVPFALAAAVLVGATASITMGTSIAGAATDQLSSVTITGNVGEKPTIDVTKPVAVKTTKRELLTTGTGEKAAKGSKVTFDFVLVNGRTGDELGTSYGDSQASILLDSKQTEPSIVKNVVGVPMGSRVVIAIAPKEGLAEASQSDTVKKTDTLLFVLDLASTRVPLARATGEAVAPVAGLPTVKLGKAGKPTIAVPKKDAPAELVAQPLIKGTGPAVQAGQTVTAHYTGIIWDTGKQFDSSWARGAAADFPIGTGGVIAGWDEGLVGQTVGSQVLLVIPPAKGYGDQGQPDAGIKGTDTLVFVVDILDAS